MVPVGEVQGTVFTWFTLKFTPLTMNTDLSFLLPWLRIYNCHCDKHFSVNLTEHCFISQTSASIPLTWSLTAHLNYGYNWEKWLFGERYKRTQAWLGVEEANDQSNILACWEYDFDGLRHVFLPHLSHSNPLPINKHLLYTMFYSRLWEDVHLWGGALSKWFILPCSIFPLLMERDS